MSSKKIKILTTGIDGMLGFDINKVFSERPNISFHGTTIADLDITNEDAVLRKLAIIQPDIVIHAAAWTAVDLAEKESEKCFAVNEQGSRNVAQGCRAIGAEMFLISTDYVFDGTKPSPYIETDKRCPISVYGRSKAGAEEAVESVLKKYKIIRTSWLNGLNLKYTGNFIEAITKKAKAGNPLRVVNDQHGKPTFTFHLALMLERLIDVDTSGIFHVTNSGDCTWYEFALKILKLQGIDSAVITPIKSEEYPCLAVRPKNSRLENKKLSELGIALLPDWEDGLKEYFKRRDIFYHDEKK